MTTPFEKLGYKVGDTFKLTCDSQGAKEGDIVYLVYDDGSHCPYFSTDRSLIDAHIDALNNRDEVYCLDDSEVEPIVLNSFADDLLSTFGKFEASLEGRFDTSLYCTKGKCTLSFDNYEFEGDEARIREVMDLVTKLHIKGV